MSQSNKVKNTSVGKTLFRSSEFLESLREDIRPHFADVMDIQTFEKTARKLSLADMQLLVDQALMLLEMFYVHMPLKRAMHAINPTQRLKLLKYRLVQIPDEKKVSEIRFHKEMIKIFTSLRDLHTNYILPAPFNDKIAFLPFLIEEYIDSEQRKYIVSKLASDFNHPTFKHGVEVLYWNGIPIDRAVDLNAERQAGSNIEAQHARGLNNMCIRPMKISLQPDEDWVIIGYRSLNGEELELRQNWLVSSEPIGYIAASKPLTREAMTLGIDIKTYAINQAKKALFAPDAVVAHDKIATGEISRAAPRLGLESSMPTVFRAREVETPYGIYGYIRIFTFYEEEPEGSEFIKKFIEEFIRLIEQLPQNGLIIDVRGNGGGYILASEGLLQLFTPRSIKPEQTQFINTPLTLELCSRNSYLSQWEDSIKQSVETGATFSQGFPLTPEEFCNAIGQIYYGPVVLITDALCYSATDIFAAGFQDNKVGKILGTNLNTGAGGANVWEYNDLAELMGNHDSRFKPLPNGARMRVAIRRTLRVNEHEGMPLEDLGVVPDKKHDMTEDDVLKDNVDLINSAARILAEMPVYKLSAKISPSPDRKKLTVKVDVENISRLDVFIGNRPNRSLDVTGNSIQFILEQGTKDIKLHGYKGEELVAVHRAEY